MQSVPPRNPFHALEDILEAIEKIRNYTAGMTFEIFAADNKTIDAVIRNLEVIGEATASVPEDFQNGHPEIPWADMRAMRNVLIHEYFGVSVPIVWDTIGRDLPALALDIEKVLVSRGRT
jgi:uncharacterized protein with HEPN domain